MKHSSSELDTVRLIIGLSGIFLFSQLIAFLYHMPDFIFWWAIIPAILVFFSAIAVYRDAMQE